MPTQSRVFFREHLEFFVSARYGVCIFFSDRIKSRVLIETFVSADGDGVDRRVIGKINVEFCRS